MPGRGWSGLRMVSPVTIRSSRRSIRSIGVNGMP